MTEHLRHLGRPLGVLTAAWLLAGGVAYGSPASAATTTATRATTATVDDAITRGANHFSYTGTWLTCRGCRSDSYRGSFHYTNRRGATARLTFTGTRAVLYALTQRAGGIATVTVDGRARGTVNLASARTAVRAVYTTPVLRQGVHTVVLTVSARTTGRGHTVTVDKAVVTGVGRVTAPPVQQPKPQPKPPAQQPPAQQPPAQQPPASSGRGVASLTFDDGQLGQFTNAGSVLRSAGVHGTFYVISDGMSWGGSSMSAAQVGQLAAQGNEIGSHTRDHEHLTSLSSAQVEAEFADSVAVLRDKAGVRAATCAYPYGEVNGTVESIAAKYFVACRGTGSGTNGSGADVYDLRVYNVNSSTTAADVRAAAEGAQAAGSWVIFVYHGVGSVLSNDDVTTAQFSSHVDALKAAGISIQTVSQAMAGR